MIRSADAVNDRSVGNSQNGGGPCDVWCSRRETWEDSAAVGRKEGKSNILLIRAFRC